ncbi:hypothetical protein [Algiphilus sp.]|uniref:hypothetical protein n=1 Tax=Algiphilus sp. TaxID=1872431 RepID=UPI0025BF593C|nr:hypothetical protein [Algiphilus sp.]MCK5772035.1 hypothetical protein [Algiphilus sp.]
MSTFGSRLREERERLRVSQEVFGSWGGVKKGAQINYESGNRRPDSEYLESIATKGVDVNYVLTGKRVVPGALWLTEGDRAAEEGAQYSVARWPAGPTESEYQLYREVVSTLVAANGVPVTAVGIERFAQQALGVFLRVMRIEDDVARRAELRDLVLLLSPPAEAGANDQ